MSSRLAVANCAAVMPPWQNTLPEEDLSELVAHIVSLRDMPEEKRPYAQNEDRRVDGSAVSPARSLSTTEMKLSSSSGR